MYSLFRAMPTCGVLIDNEANIIEANLAAAIFLGFNSEEEMQAHNAFDFVIDLKKAKMLLKKVLLENGFRDIKLLLRSKNGSIICVIMYACFIPRQKQKILLQFFEYDKNAFLFQSKWADMFLCDVQQLQSHLNTEGRSILKRIIKKYKQSKEIEFVRSRTLNKVIDQDIKAVSATYPTLSSSEVNISALLCLNLTTQEISVVLNQTVNAVRVTLHRILTKLNLSSRDELIECISECISDYTTLNS